MLKYTVTNEKRKEYKWKIWYYSKIYEMFTLDAVEWAVLNRFNVVF